VWGGNQSRKNAFPKKLIADSNFTKSDAIVLSSPACCEIALENSVVHGRVAHPSTTRVAAPYTAAMAATHALASKRSPSRFCFRPFFLHLFSSFLSLFFFPPSESAIEMMA